VKEDQIAWPYLPPEFEREHLDTQLHKLAQVRRRHECLGPVVVNGYRALGQLLFALRIKRRRAALEMCLLHRGHDGGMAGTEFRPDLRPGSHSIVHVVTVPPLSPCGSTHVSGP